MRLIKVDVGRRYNAHNGTAVVATAPGPSAPMIDQSEVVIPLGHAFDTPVRTRTYELRLTPAEANQLMLELQTILLRTKDGTTNL